MINPITIHHPQPDPVETHYNIIIFAPVSTKGVNDCDAWLILRESVSEWDLMSALQSHKQPLKQKGVFFASSVMISMIFSLKCISVKNQKAKNES